MANGQLLVLQNVTGNPDGVKSAKRDGRKINGPRGGGGGVEMKLLKRAERCRKVNEPDRIIETQAALV